MINSIKQIFAARKTQPDYPGDTRTYYFPRNRGGVYVTHEKALELSACFGCCRTISEDIAKLPWNVYQMEDQQRTRLDGSALHVLLNTRPNPNMTAFTFRETMMMWALTWGNGYAEIERNLAGKPVALWPISPDRVEPKRDENGSVYYVVNNQRQEQSIVEQREMFHIHGIGWDGLMGYSMIGLAATTLGFGLAAEEHGSNYFGNNTTIGLALKTDMALGEQAYARLKEEIDGRQGSSRAYEGMILEQGLDFAYPSNTTQQGAQFVETRRQIVEEVCRWFRVPPHKVAELSRAHFANVENLNIDYATDALMPWIKRLEEEADWKLIGARSQVSYTKIAIQALMRGDSAARAQWYREMSHIGVFSINEIRALEDMDPIGPEGDERYMQSQFTTINRILQEAEEPIVEEQDNSMEMVESVAARLFQPELNKAQSAVMRYGQDREAFVEWMNIQNLKAADRRLKAFEDIQPVIGDKSASDLAAVYLYAERKQLLSFFDGAQPDVSEITKAVLEAL